MRTLLTEIVDYAGLFPPSAHAMEEAVSRYARARTGDHTWMLGRFIVPVAKLGAFESAAATYFPTETDDEPWRLSALVSPDDLDAHIEAIFTFNRAHEDGSAPGRVVVDAIETRVPSASAEGAGFIDQAMKTIPEQLDPSFELPLGYDLRGVITALAGTGGKAKMRTGGVTPDLIPAPETVADFVLACHAADVPFKATAGLHEALCGERPLTYAGDAPRARMHGFLNLFVMAALVRRADLNRDDAIELLTTESADALEVTGDHIVWQGHTITAAQIASARESFATSFGSCSFDEPIESLRAIGLLPVEAAG